MGTKIVATMATYPARGAAAFEAARSIASQVDRLTMVLNEYTKDDLLPQLPENVSILYPPEDFKDVGKFYPRIEPTDFVLLCDDDIVYPEDYASVLRRKWEKASQLQAVVGVHGVTYSDFFDGDPLSRIVHVFTQALHRDCFVNQLGTGTVLCRGFQMPTFEYMQGSARFVDLRFARYCESQRYPRICVARERGWMAELKTGPSLFETFTKNWPPEIVMEAQEIAGLRFLPRESHLDLSEGNDFYGNGHL